MSRRLHGERDSSYGAVPAGCRERRWIRAALVGKLIATKIAGITMDLRDTVKAEGRAIRAELHSPAWLTAHPST
jgi:hypothetical protein